MGAFLVRRTVYGALTVFVISIATFMIFFLIPTGDPAVRIAGKNPTPELLEAIREKYHLNDSLPQQYVFTMKQLVTGQIKSFNVGVKIVPMAAKALPVTLSLCLVASTMWLIAGVSIGIYSARRPGSRLDGWLTIAALIGLSAPVIWLCMVMIYIFTVKLPIFPPGDYLTIYRGGFLGWLYHLILPGMTLAITFAASYALITRTNVSSSMREEWVKTAVSKGIPHERVFVHHVLRLAMIPVIIMFGMDFSMLLAGAIFTETIFGLPGLGSVLMIGIKNYDFPILLMMTLFSCVLIVVSNMLVDIVQAIFDPRIRLG